MRRLRVLGLILAVCAIASSARAENKWVLVGGLGAFDLPLPTNDEDIAAAYEMEVRIKPGLWWLHPHVGFQGTADGMVYGYAGLHLDIPVGPHFRIVPSESVGLYDHGNNDKNLDGLMEFRIGGGIAWQFTNGWRVGATYYHMSNAGTGDSNPGAEMMFLELGFALP